MNKKIIPLALAGMLGIVTAGSALADTMKCAAALSTNLNNGMNVTLKYVQSNRIGYPLLTCEHKYDQSHNNWALLSTSSKLCKPIGSTPNWGTVYIIPKDANTTMALGETYLRSIKIQAGNSSVSFTMGETAPLQYNPLLEFNYIPSSKTNLNGIYMSNLNAYAKGSGTDQHGDPSSVTCVVNHDPSGQ